MEMLRFVFKGAMLTIVGSFALAFVFVQAHDLAHEGRQTDVTVSDRRPPHCQSLNGVYGCSVKGEKACLINEEKNNER